MESEIFHFSFLMEPPPTQNYMIEQNSENNAISLYEETPKQFLNRTPTPKIALQGPKKSKMTPKLSQNRMSEFKVT